MPSGAIQTRALHSKAADHPDRGVDRPNPAFSDTGIAYAGVALPRGGTTPAFPYPAPAVTASGASMAGFAGDFYNRLHFVPATVDFAAVTSDTDRLVEVWNAYLTEQELGAVSWDAGQKVGIQGGPAGPVIFKALQVTTYTFRALQEGPPALAGSFVFPLAGRDWRLPFAGTRAAIFPLRHNWEHSFTETAAYRTEIVHRTRKGKEQRRSHRVEPRRAVAMRGWLNGTARDAMRRLLANWRGKPALVPVEPRRANVADVGTGATALTLSDPAPRWLVPGIQALLRSSQDPDGLVISVSDVSGQTVTLTQALGAAADEPRLVLLQTGRLRGGVKEAADTNNLSSFRLDFDLAPGEDPAFAPPVAPVTTLGGLEVFTRKPNWAREPEFEWDDSNETTDFGKGRIAYRELLEFPQMVVEFYFSGLRDGAVSEIEDSFDRNLGQAGEIWIPSWVNDLEAAFDLIGTSSTLRVAGTEVADAYADLTTHRAVWIETHSGEVLLREIQDLYSVSDIHGEGSVFEFAVPWAATVTPGEIKRISWLHRARFSTDSLRIDWQSDNYANVKLNFTILEALA